MDPRKPAFDKARAIVGVLDDRDVRMIHAALDGVGFERAPEPMRRTINRAGLDLIKSFEGLRLAAYKCPAGILTIGYGSTGAHVRAGMTITRDEAETLLLQDICRFEECVDRACPGLNDNQFAACVSLAYNIGCAAFERSTVCRMANAGNHTRAKLAFSLWVKASGKTLAGLVRRRAAEAELYGRPA